MRQCRRSRRIELKPSAARTVLADFMMRRRRMIAVHRARPPPWPSNIIGPPRLEGCSAAISRAYSCDRD
jgi:hypothetical protein